MSSYKAKLYLDYLNNFLSLGAFCEYYQLAQDKAEKLIREGKAEHHNLPVLADRRYTIRREFSGKQLLEYVVRFEGNFIYSSASWNIAADYAQKYSDNGHKA